MFMKEESKDDLSLKYECVMYSCTSSIFHDDFAQVTETKKTAEDLVAVEPPLPLQEALPLAPDVEVQNKRKYKRWLLEMTTDLVDAIGTLGGNDKATPTDVLRLISIKHNNLIKEEVEEKLKRWRKAQRANT
ncbi:Homeodomain-like protein [Raphanus sativus]|nr:Homeodomain-like protein [Raphanus sativus]